MVVGKISYTPSRGDIVNIDFNPQAGKEILKRRYGLVLSTQEFNKDSLAFIAPITSTIHNEVFEVLIPQLPNINIRGAILTNQVKSLDWEVRKAIFECKLPKSTVAEVLAKVKAILS